MNFYLLVFHEKVNKAVSICHLFFVTKNQQFEIVKLCRFLRHDFCDIPCMNPQQEIQRK